MASAPAVAAALLPALALVALTALAAVSYLVWKGRTCRRDLARLAELLDGEAPGAARARTESGDSDVRALAAAVNRHLDAECDRAAARAAAEARFHEELAALSHDLRTPLAGARGYLQLAERARAAGRPDQEARHLEGAAERLGALGVLVDDLFSYSRATDPSFRPELAETDEAAVVAEVLAARYADFRARGWEPEVALDPAAPRVLAHGESLRRIVENLVENSLVHGASAPTVRLEGPVLTVRNGLSAEDAEALDDERLSERFYQGNRARTGRGSGLGLAVASALARAQGARLEASVERGARPAFCVRLELAPA